jgi:hypothetical protein
MSGHADLTRLGAVDAREVLRLAWDDWFEEPFGGLAEPGEMDAPPQSQDPFADAGHGFGMPAAHDARLWLLLVPCNRPADALAILDWSYSEMAPEVTAALLSSWEERFAAVPVQLQPASVVLHIGAPPTSLAQAHALTAEIAATTEEVLDSDSLDAGAQLLLSPGLPPPTGPCLTNTAWQITFRQQCPAELCASWFVDGAGH